MFLIYFILIKEKVYSAQIILLNSLSSYVFLTNSFVLKFSKFANSFNGNEQLSFGETNMISSSDLSGYNKKIEINFIN